MEDGNYWRSRASEMRTRAAGVKDPFISNGFLALAEQYDRLAADGARWFQSKAAQSASQPSEKNGRAA